jgi:hypothetical protein
MQFIAARFAEEPMLMPIGFFSMTTAGAALAGVLGVYLDGFHTEGIRLVADKLRQLIKGPNGSSPCAVAYEVCAHYE